MGSSLHDSITRDYYRTTAVRGHESTRAHYEANAGHLARRLGPWLPHSNARCIDLACGCGDFVYLLEKRGAQSTMGVDLCADELEQGRQFVRGPLVEADLVDFLDRQPDASADFISALNILEHLPKDKLMAVMHGVRRVLAPGGVLVAMVPNAVSPFGTMTRHWDLTHEWAFTGNNFRQLAALTGFDPHIELRECGPVAHGLVSGVRYLLWRALHYAIAGYLMIELASTKDAVYTADMLVRMRAPVAQP